jgi:hypothetical protein
MKLREKMLFVLFSVAVTNANAQTKTELRWVGGTPYIALYNDASIDYDARIILNSDDALVVDGAKVGIGESNPTSRLTINGLEGSTSSLLIRNSSYTSTQSTGTAALQFAFADHVGPKLEAYKITSNATGLKFYTENGLNVSKLALTIHPYQLLSEAELFSLQKTGSNAGLQVHSGSNNSSLQFIRYGVKHAGLVFDGSTIIFKGMSGGEDFNPDLTLNNSETVNAAFLGNVGIGTRDTKGYRFAVAGSAIAEEVVVKLQANWPDYVFEAGYKLPSLLELQLYIAQNKHLPGIPSANEVNESGIALGEMNVKLLKKIEELTLYLIELKKENIIQEQAISKQQELLLILQKQLDAKKHE